MSEKTACPECRHILPSGRKCHAPALHGKVFCYYHLRQRSLIERNRYRSSSVAIPPIEDRSALQIAIGEVLHAFADRKIDRHAAGLYLYALQIASHNLDRAGSFAPADSVDRCVELEGQVVAPYHPPSDVAHDPDNPAWPPRNPAPEPASSPDYLDLLDKSATHEYDDQPHFEPILTPAEQQQVEIGQRIFVANHEAWLLSREQENRRPSTQPLLSDAPEPDPDVADAARRG